MGFSHHEEALFEMHFLETIKKALVIFHVL